MSDNNYAKLIRSFSVAKVTINKHLETSFIYLLRLPILLSKHCQQGPSSYISENSRFYFKKSTSTLSYKEKLKHANFMYPKDTRENAKEKETFGILFYFMF